MTPNDLFQAGKLHDAVDALTNELKSNPTDTGKRLFLAELLCFVGDIDRAEKQLDTITLQTTQGAMTLTLYRQLLRGESAREQVLLEGRQPEIVVQLGENGNKLLEALLALRLGQNSDAFELFAAAEATRPHPTGVCNGKPFDEFRDLDDRVAGFLEVVTSHGKYFWVPLTHIVSLEFSPPKVPIDLLYRSAQIQVHNGPEGEVYIPTRYKAPNEEAQAEDLLLGRATDWTGNEGQCVQGRGLRSFLVGEDVMTIMEIESFSMNESSYASLPKNASAETGASTQTDASESPES